MSFEDFLIAGILTLFCLDVGDFVEADEVVARIETDKVTVDILSTHAGVITKYYAEEGDNIEVGANFLEIDTDAKGSAAPAAPKKEEPVPAKVSPQQVPRSPRVSILLIIIYQFNRLRRHQPQPPRRTPLPLLLLLLRKPLLPSKLHPKRLRKFQLRSTELV